jgi:tRNA threonylcarbamoyladenosine biosynthesis protein TsaB
MTPNTAAAGELSAILAIDASDRAGSVCLWTSDGRELASRQVAAGQAPADLVPAIDAVLSGVTQPVTVAVAVGPGSFTGLRIAVVAARTLAWVEGWPVRSVGTMAALAAAQGPGLWWSLVPLKKDTTFHALYRVDDAGLVDEIIAPTPCLDRDHPVLADAVAAAVAIGPALHSKPGLAEHWCPGIAVGSSEACSAQAVARLAVAEQRAGRATAEWHSLVPAYHIASAPELERAARQAATG